MPAGNSAVQLKLKLLIGGMAEIGKERQIRTIYFLYFLEMFGYYKFEDDFVLL